MESPCSLFSQGGVGGHHLGRVQCRLDLLLRPLGDSWEAAEGLIQVEAILSCCFFFFSLLLLGFSQASPNSASFGKPGQLSICGS